MSTYWWLTIGLAGVQLLYLRVARQWGLIDTPNERSSHTSLTIVRGGGMLFYVAALAAGAIEDFGEPCFLAGLTLIALTGFVDDLNPLPNSYRIGAQVMAVGLLLLQTGVLPSGWWVFAGVLLVGVGTLNAYNFMDGINGMTAFYSLVTIGTLWYGVAGSPATGAPKPNGLPVLLPAVFVALLIFSYFNARRRAVCFAGDVGSLSMAFVVLYGMQQFILARQTYLPVLLLAVYGIDSVLTIGHRLWLGQNIFRAHRLHLFQLLVHRWGWPHLGINALVWQAFDWSWVAQLTLAGCMLGPLAGAYVVIKQRLMADLDA